MKEGKAETLEEAFIMLRIDIPATNKEFRQYHISRKSCYSVDELLLKIKMMNKSISILGVKTTPIDARIIFTGQRGVGKTTELHFIENELQNEFEVIFIDSLNDGLNFKDFQYTDLLIVLLKRIIEKVPGGEKSLNKDLANKIQLLLSQLIGEYDSEKTKIKNRGWSIAAFFEIIGGQLLSETETREKFTKRAQTLWKEFINYFNELVDIVESTQKKKIIIIVDDLEKVTDWEIIENFLITKIDVVKRLKCNIIFTIPPTLRFSDQFRHIKETFHDELFLPIYGIFTQDKEFNKKDIDEMCKIVNERVDTKLIDRNALKLCVLYSGGIVNDMLLMCSDACVKAISQGQNSVNTKCVREAFDEVRSDYESALSGALQETSLEQVHTNKKLNGSIDNSHNLFICAILAYKNMKDDETWYDTNPALWPKIEVDALKVKVENDK